MSTASYNLKRTVITSYQQPGEVESSDDLYNDVVYVLHLASPRLTTVSTTISSALSDRSIVSFNRETMQKLNYICNAHDKQIMDLKMIDENIIASCSEDGYVKFFDIREHTSGNSTASVSCKLPKTDEALSISFGYQGILLAVGSDNGVINFFDTRNLSNSNDHGQQQPLGQYVDAHTKEVTKVQFMQNNDKILATGSEDGLVSIYDTSQPCEESALKSVLNIETSIRSLDFFGPQNEQGISPGLWCLTGNETMNVWHWDTAQRMCTYGDNDIRRRLTDATSSQFGCIDYLIGAEWNDHQEKLSLLTGSSNGNAAIFHVSNDETFVLDGELIRGHMGCIRAYDSNGASIITGGEDARLCEWSKANQIPGVSRKSVVARRKKNTYKIRPY